MNGGEGMDLLASIAEISVAFAGFAGIITALSGRRFGELGRGNLTRFRLMIYSSLSATFMALMPYAFLYNASTPNWWVCILLLMIYLVGFLSLLIRVFIRQVAQGSLNGYVAFFGGEFGRDRDTDSAHIVGRPCRAGSGHLPLGYLLLACSVRRFLRAPHHCVGQRR